MNGLQTEFDFVLPKGYIDNSGTLHRRGTMRLATARDEMDPLRDPRVQDANDPYLTIIVLSRVVTQLGTLSQVTPADIENLFAADLAFLQDLYGIINFGSADELAALQASFAPPAAPAPSRPTVRRRQPPTAPSPTNRLAPGAPWSKRSGPARGDVRCSGIPSMSSGTRSPTSPTTCTGSSTPCSTSSTPIGSGSCDRSPT